MSFGNRNNNNNSRPQGKEDAPNKVKFSSVKLGETKQGSPTIGLYLKKEQMQKLIGVLMDMDNANEDGCKLSCIVISGKDYDSGYAYVNPKEQRQQDGNNNAGGGQYRGGYKQTNSNFSNKSQARDYLKGKRVDDGEAQG